MGTKFSKIDEITMADHSYLSEQDECYYWGEYTSYKGFEHSETNDLIYNLKKSPEKKGKPEWEYKLRAITKIADLIRCGIGQQTLLNYTLTPIPPSLIKSDSNYDNRMTQVLNCVKNQMRTRIDIRELIMQIKSISPSHISGRRYTPNELLENYAIDDSLTEPAPQRIMLFDDVITTGAHFIAARRILLSKFPEAIIKGVFVARRAVNT